MSDKTAIELFDGLLKYLGHTDHLEGCNWIMAGGKVTLCTCWKSKLPALRAKIEADAKAKIPDDLLRKIRWALFRSDNRHLGIELEAALGVGIFKTEGSDEVVLKKRRKM